jgi:formylglycine-generating enzyme required for sulfatase activity
MFLGKVSYADDGLSKEVERLIERTLKNMVFVEGGTFMMGDQKSTFINAFGEEEYGYFHPAYTDARPAHKVVLKDYYLSKYEITFGEHDLYSAIAQLEQALPDEVGKIWRGGPDHPARVSWAQANDYCAWLGEQTGLPFALPTEAQWEFAARSRGKVVPFATDTGYVERGVNYPESTYWPGPVGQFPPNPLGLHDMSGNVHEWVADFYDPDYYSRSPVDNPQGPQSGESKVYRGGGTGNSPGGSSTIIRGEGRYTEEYSRAGFRCVINTSEPLPIHELATENNIQ